MRIFHISVCLLGMVATLLAGAPLVNAQAPVAGLEGPILSVGADRMNVMGVTVLVGPTVPISSPSASLTLDQIGGAPLPGRTTQGFIGGTAIVNGVVLPNGSVRATDVFVEPMEGVLIGVITASTCTNARCTGVGDVFTLLRRPLRRIADPRMPSGPILNDFGFQTNLTGANLVGAVASAEGYYANNRFYYHVLEITGAPLARPGRTEVSIQRAQCREDADGIQLNLLGGVHDPNSGVVSITAGTVSGAATAIAAPPGVFGSYAFRDDFPGVTRCPATVTVRFGGATASAELDITPLN